MVDCLERDGGRLTGLEGDEVRAPPGVPIRCRTRWKGSALSCDVDGVRERLDGVVARRGREPNEGDSGWRIVVAPGPRTAGEARFAVSRLVASAMGRSDAALSRPSRLGSSAPDTRFSLSSRGSRPPLRESSGPRGRRA